MLHMPITIKLKSTACLHFAVEENKPTKHEKCIYIRILLKIRVSLSEDKILTPVLIIIEDLFLNIVLCHTIQMSTCTPWVGLNAKKKLCNSFYYKII